MTSCPACHKPVDPLRSRFVGVRDGKIVAFCSAECAATASPEAARAAAPAASGRGAAAAPAAAPPPAAVNVRALSPATGVPARIATPATGISVGGATPASGIPSPVSTAPGLPFSLESGPVIEIIHEPTSGVVTSARDARDEHTAPRARHPDEIPIAAFWSADKEKEKGKNDKAGAHPEPVGAASDVGAVAAVGELAELAVVPPAGDHDIPPTRQIRAFRVATDGELVLAPRSRWPLVLVIALIALGGGVALYYVYGRSAGPGSSAAAPRAGSLAPRGEESRAARAMTAVAVAAVALPHAGGEGATAAAQPARAAAPAVGAAPLAVEPSADPAAAVAQARAALHSDLAATSLRVQRLAAAALARTADPEAVALLAAQLGLTPAAPVTGGPVANATDDLATSDIARLGLAYALARAGDPRGRDVLAGALGSPRGEARDEAARLLALLGDRRAVPHLLDLLAVDQRRLGAAEHLARLAEPHALKVLDQIRGDARRTADDKARATVALGIAGRAEVAGALRDMLADPHFNAFASAALAALADAAARPVLERQLASPPLRVLAARALRRLDPSLDPRPLLPALLDVVRTGRDVVRIPAAEAILVLAGPARWAAYD